MKTRRSLLSATLVRFFLVAAFLFGAGIAPRGQRIAAWMRAGQQAAGQGEYEQAVMNYGHVLRILGSQPAVFQQLAQASLDAGHYADARAYLYRVADQAGWNPARRDQMRLILEHDGEKAQSIALIYAALDDGNADPAALRDLAREQIARLEWSQAAIVLEYWLATEPDSAEAAYLLGILLAPEHHKQAAAYLSDAARDPAWAGRAAAVQAALAAYDVYALTDAHMQLGIALIRLGEWPFAEHALQLALDVNAVNPTALAYLGYARDQQGRDGLADIQDARAMNPNDPLIYYLLGLHWRQAQDHRQAYEAFNHAYWLDAANPALAAEVAVSLQNLSDLAGAATWYQQAVELAPADIQWRRLLAAFYADTGFELESSGLAFIEQAHAIAPDDADIQASLGWAYQQLDDTRRAYDELSAAVSADPAQPRSRYYFGVVLERRGDVQGAADSYWFVVQAVGADSPYGLLASRALQRLGM